MADLTITRTHNPDSRYPFEYRFSSQNPDVRMWLHDLGWKAEQLWGAPTEGHREKKIAEILDGLRRKKDAAIERRASLEQETVTI